MYIQGEFLRESLGHLGPRKRRKSLCSEKPFIDWFVAPGNDSSEVFFSTWDIYLQVIVWIVKLITFIQCLYRPFLKVFVCYPNLQVYIFVFVGTVQFVFANCLFVEKFIHCSVQPAQLPTMRCKPTASNNPSLFYLLNF